MLVEDFRLLFYRLPSTTAQVLLIRMEGQPHTEISKQRPDVLVLTLTSFPSIIIVRDGFLR